MVCPNCSKELPRGVATCPECGTQLESDPTVTYVPLRDGRDLPISAEEAGSVAGIQGYGLVVDRGPQAGMTYVLAPGTTTVGRHPDSDIFLDDVTVSRHHCRFIWDGDEFIVEDSGSTNGTYVNGGRVDRATLRPGDEVLVGRFHLLVARGDG